MESKSPEKSDLSSSEETNMPECSDFNWNAELGGMEFLGTPGAVFWLNPSLLQMLSPLVQEVGEDLFRLLTAHSSSLGNREYLRIMKPEDGASTEETFGRFANILRVAGWGSLKLENFDLEKKYAEVIVENPWELVIQKNLPKAATRWGCPFLQGKLTGIFFSIFRTGCWATESIESWDSPCRVKYTVEASTRTIPREIISLRNKRLARRARQLQEAVDEKTQQLALAQRRLEDYSNTLEERIEQRTLELRVANDKSQDAVSRKELLVKALSKAVKSKLAKLTQPLESLINTCPENYHGDLQQIAETVLDIHRGLSTLLDSTQLGKESLEELRSLREVDFEKVAEGSIKTIGQDFDLQKTSLSREISSEISKVSNTDAVKIETIITHLLNASLNLLNSGGKINLEASEQDAGSGVQKVSIKVSSVSDENLFQAGKEVMLEFDKIDDSVSKEFESALLDLTIASEVSLGMGGKLKLGSQLGMGFIFEASVEVS